MIGQRFGKVVVVCFSHSTGDKTKYWKCRCDCGNESIARGTSLRYGSTKSCGCGSRTQASENMKAIGLRSRSQFWPFTRRFKDTHRNMMRRCYDTKDRRYESYGGRGIIVCPAWHDRATFSEWLVSAGFAEGLSIDRINVDGNYCPENCRLANAVEQANNTTRNRILNFNGKSQTVAQWARDIGVSSHALQHRITRNWPIDRALTQPFR